MQVNRKELLDSVERVKPAIASQKVIEELQNVWFSGESITAYNSSSLGIRIPFKSNLSGGLRGNLLLDLLKNSRAKELDVELKEEVAEIRAGKTKINLALLPRERCPWKFPKLDRPADFTASEELLGALSNVLVSIGSGTTKPEQLGVSFVNLKDNDIDLYTTDSNTVSGATCTLEGWPEDISRSIWPTAFVEQLIRFPGAEIWVDQYKVIAKAEGISLFTSTVDNPSPMNFDDMIGELPATFEIPDRLNLALERASTMLKGFPNETISIKLQDGVMRLLVSTPLGELRENIKVKSDISAKCRTNPDFIKRCLDRTSGMGFADNCLTMVGTNFAYYISVMGDD